jgi:hypothetical protein
MLKTLESISPTICPSYQRLVQLATILVVFFVILQFSTSKAESAQTTLMWDPPVNVDGTPFTGVAGYYIYYGTASGIYTQSINAGNVTTYTVNTLSDGTTYYFVVTDFDSMGNESGFSNEVSKTFPAATTPPTPATYLLTATASNGGTIKPLGNIPINQASNQTSTISTLTVTQGTNVSFSIAASQGFQIAGVTVDGVSVGKITSYTFNNINRDHTITASFSSTTPTVAVKGDLDNDGVVSLEDALTVLRAVTNNTALPADQKTRADVWPLNSSNTPQGDGVINLNDALLILRRAVGLVTW